MKTTTYKTTITFKDETDFDRINRYVLLATPLDTLPLFNTHALVYEARNLYSLTTEDIDTMLANLTYHAKLLNITWNREELLKAIEFQTGLYEQTIEEFEKRPSINLNTPNHFKEQSLTDIIDYLNKNQKRLIEKINTFEEQCLDKELAISYKTIADEMLRSFILTGHPRPNRALLNTTSVMEIPITHIVKAEASRLMSSISLYSDVDLTDCQFGNVIKEIARLCNQPIHVTTISKTEAKDIVGEQITMDNIYSNEIKISNDTIDKTIAQLNDLIGHALDFMDENDPDDVWSQDKTALEIAIKCLKALKK